MNTPPDDPDEERLDALLAVVRAAQPDTSRLEYGFETRLMARLAADAAKPAFWSAAWSWRLTPFFAVLALGLSLWTRFMPLVYSPDDQTGAALEWAVSADDDLDGLFLDDFLSAS